MGGWDCIRSTGGAGYAGTPLGVRVVAALLVTMCALLAAAAARAAPLSSTEGTQFSGQVGTLTTSHCDTLTVGPSGTISWGDGQSSSASYTYVVGTFPNQYTVSGSHAYGEEGAYVGTVSSSYTCGRTFTSSSSFPEQVRDAALSATAGSVSATARQPFSGPVASFTDADPGGTAADYTAQIDWGDAASSAGSITAGGGDRFVVQGSHRYAIAGKYQVTVTITDAGGGSTVAHDKRERGGTQPAPAAASAGPRDVHAFRAAAGAGKARDAGRLGIACAGHVCQVVCVGGQRRSSGAVRGGHSPIDHSVSVARRQVDQAQRHRLRGTRDQHHARRDRHR